MQRCVRCFLLPFKQEGPAGRQCFSYEILSACPRVEMFVFVEINHF